MSTSRYFLPRAIATVRWTDGRAYLTSPSASERLAHARERYDRATATGMALGPEALARATLAVALIEGGLDESPQDGAVTCRFYWNDEAGVAGAECVAGGQLAHQVAKALEAFWKVDARSYGGGNTKKWHRIARGG